jgi:hypothetical protein
MFVVGPWLQKSRWVGRLADHIEETGIDAGALYYTEVEEAGEAETIMRNTMKYLPESRE